MIGLGLLNVAAQPVPVFPFRPPRLAGAGYPPPPLPAGISYGPPPVPPSRSGYAFSTPTAEAGYAPKLAALGIGHGPPMPHAVAGATLPPAKQEATRMAAPHGLLEHPLLALYNLH
jgi:hypothetical protein